MSAILSADDLNDFITPGAACIKPIETLPTASAEPGSVEGQVILDGQHPSTSTAHAQISLTDCLACSGCVTSAEAVLVSLQSHSEVLDTLNAAPALQMSQDGRIQGLEDPTRKLFVASVSPQTRANLAAACGGRVTEQQAGRMVEELLRGDKGLPAGGRWGNGFTWVLDTNTAREVSLVVGADELASTAATKPRQPILTSSCPGWVCYAEKTHPYVLSHLSRVKSPQALMGTLIKTVLSCKLGIPPDRIWHLAVMPCFDKKLEASREELTDAVWGGDGAHGRGVRDIDCVITTKEILMLADSRGLDFFSMSKLAAPPGQPAFPDAVLHNFLFPPARTSRQPRAAGTSGGNLHFILRDVQSHHPGSTIQTTHGRNVDVVEYAVTTTSGDAVFKAAKYYGFRNIQNLVRKLKPAAASRMPGVKPWGSTRRRAGKATSLEFGYIEVMACPGGCTNGGGQIKVDDPIVVNRRGVVGKPGPQEQRDWLAEVDEAYFSSEETDRQEADDVIDGVCLSSVRNVVAHWARITGIGVDTLVYTSFRVVASDVGKAQTDEEKILAVTGKIGGGW